MAKTTILTLKWDHNEGEAVINFAGLDKLFGIEKMDFLDDVIAALVQKRDEMVPGCFEEYNR
jgi:hypothetical protein